MYQVTRLPNGLTVATASMPHMASVSLGLWVEVGGRHESAAQNGISHFIEHMVFKGTRKRSAAEISQAVEGIGGYINAWTAEENSCFYSKARHDRLEELLDVLVDMLADSAFDPVEIRKERGVIGEEIAMYRDEPHLYVQELLNETMWPGQPLGRCITGTEKTIRAFGRSRLLEHLHRHYTAPNMLIAAAGRVEHRRLVASVKRRANHFRNGPHRAFEPAVFRQTRPALRLCTRKTEQTQAALGFRSCSRHDERRFAVRILNAVLGENMSSRLFQNVREEHGLAYSIHSQPSFFQDTGDIVISAGLDDDQLVKTLKLVVKELRLLREKNVPASELRRAKDYVIGQMEMSLENTEPQMTWLGEHWLGYGRLPDPEGVRCSLDRVTAAEIRAAAAVCFRPERCALALVSPMKNAGHLRPVLEKI